MSYFILVKAYSEPVTLFGWPANSIMVTLCITDSRIKTQQVLNSVFSSPNLVTLSTLEKDEIDTSPVLLALA